MGTVFGSFVLRSSRAGMSLLELVAVLAVVSILASLSLGVLEGVRERSRHMQTEATLAGVRNALEAYRLQYGSYPVIEAGDGVQRSLQLSRSLAGELLPDGRLTQLGRPLIEPDGIFRDGGTGAWVDAWGTPLFYGFSPDWRDRQYVLMSGGPDGRMDVPDDSGRYDGQSIANRDNLKGDGGSG